MKAAILAVCLLSSTAWSQTFSPVPLSPVMQEQPLAARPTEPQMPSYANYSIMLVNPAGGAVVLMHTPKNELEYVDVAKIKAALADGYVPLRTAEIGELITGLDEEVIRLRAENERLRQVQTKMDTQSIYSPAPPPVDLIAQQQAQAAAEKATRQQQLLQAWMILQGMNRPQTLNLNVTDCTRAPCIR